MTKEEAWRRTKGYLYDALSDEEADEIIMALEPKTGHWIVDKTDKEGVHIIDYKCSCCNIYNVSHGDFCKWCGAKMVEPQKRR